MQESRDDLMSIVVLETGAAWPAWLAEYQQLAPNAVVIAQVRGEALDTFRARVIHRMQEAAISSGARVRVGVIIVAPVAGEELLELRESVARALLQLMGSSNEAELVLVGDGHETDPARHELFAIAGALCEELGGSKVDVHVRFSNNKSGIMCSLAPLTPDAELTSKGGA